MFNGRVIENVRLCGFSQGLRGVSLSEFKGSTYSDEHCLLHTMNTRVGQSGSPLLVLTKDGYVTRGIHQRTIDYLFEEKQNI